MTVVRFKNLNVGRSRPSNKFKTHSIGNENLGYNKEDTSSVLGRSAWLGAFRGVMYGYARSLSLVVLRN